MNNLASQQGILGLGLAPNLQTGSWCRWSVPGSRGLSVALLTLKAKNLSLTRDWSGQITTEQARWTQEAPWRRTRMGRLEQHSGVGGMLAPKCHLLGKLHSTLGDPPGQASQVAQSVKNSPAVPNIILIKRPTWQRTL